MCRCPAEHSYMKPKFDFCTISSCSYPYTLASIHRDPSTDGEMSRLNQADMEQTLEVRLENKNQNKKVIWDISGYVTQGRDFRE